MQTAVRFRVRKDLAPHEQHRVLQLKGNLISRGYTQIIHISDQDEEFHLNTFETPREKGIEVQQYIKDYISAENLSESISIT
ncbi:hypothetical protein C4F50_15660 [Flavobacterium sp. KB82]|uniref:Uncharacterized protein n=1 Tax=Flavobacterium hungaricum TaxID=2082725 RepID=A0ABR9TP05_9FLAO|nr:hypothetical protein [Flavobacterium hungaricum]MBE8726367.1 hypothetical protein [Flavobacterium hungaricum]